MDQQTVSIILAFGGWIVAVVLAITNYLDRVRERQHNLFLNALSYLTGGSQKRSVGIAIIEGLWESSEKFRHELIPALTNQAIYLLLDSDERDRKHEVHTLLRIMGLLINQTKYKKEYRHLYTELLDALDFRISNLDYSKGVGIEKTIAELWKHKIISFAELN